MNMVLAATPYSQPIVNIGDIILTLWVVLMIPAFILLKYRRENLAFFKAIVWPLFLVLLVVARANTNAKRQQPPAVPPPAPAAERPKYGLIDRADDAGE